MSRYQAYPEYKDSGVEWFPVIPKNWTLLRYKNSVKIFQGMAFKSSDYVDHSEVINIRMGNIKKGGVIDLEHNLKYLPSHYANLFQGYKLVNGDVIMAMTDMSPSLDFLAVPALLDGLQSETNYLLNQRVGKLIVNKNFDVRFLKYSLLSNELRAQLKSLGLGTVQANMSNDDLYSSYYASPSDTEKTQIANFLDHETAKIDTLIEKQQQLIQLLKEKRQAVISHAVTKGLNPDVPMKDSGVEWLGEVPEGWDVTKLKYYSTMQGGYAFNSDSFSAEGVQLLRIGNVYQNQLALDRQPVFVSPAFVAELRTFVVSKGDILMSLTGTLGKRDYGYAVHVDQEGPFLLNQRVAKVSPIVEKINPSHLINILLSESYLSQLYSLPSGTKQANLSNDNVLNIFVAIPPCKEEQAAISDFINSQLNHFDDVISKGDAAIELMQERRTALISAAVTGKIDVRSWQAPQN